MSNSAAENALKQFNYEGWDAIEPYFHTFENFFRFLVKNGLDEELNFANIPDDAENQYLAVMLESKPDKTLQYIIDNLITDVEKRGDGYYLYLRDREELSKLFRESSRGGDARSIAKHVLDEDWWEPYYDTTYDVYTDVYEDFTKENKQYFYTVMFEKLSGEQIEPETDLLEEVAEEQGHPEYVEITMDNLPTLMEDTETGKHLLNVADDIKQELYSLHNTAYNNAYNDEVWDEVWSELGTIFEGKIDSIPRQVKRTDGSEITRYDNYIKIKDFPGFIKTFLDENPQNNYNSDSLGYYGEFIGTVTELMDNGQMDWLDFRIPDYPDFRKVSEYINDAIRDYI